MRRLALAWTLTLLSLASAWAGGPRLAVEPRLDGAQPHAVPSAAALVAAPPALLAPAAGPASSEARGAEAARTAEAAPPSAVERLDDVLLSAGGPAGLMDSGKHRGAYLQLAQEYYGAKKFAQESYDAVLGQLRPMLEQAPGLGERLMESDGLGEPYSLTLTRHAWGREVDRGRWDARLDRLLGELRATADPAGDPHARAAARVLAELDGDAGTRAMLRSDSAEFVLEAVESVRQRLRSRPDGLEDLEIRIAPRGSDLILDKETFPQATLPTRSGAVTEAGRAKLGTHWFKPAPRRFHTIFAGIPSKQCSGGACDRLEELTPKNWALSALRGSQFHFMETDGRFRGALRGVPRLAAGGRAFLAFDYLAADLGSAALTIDPVTGLAQAGRLFDFWFERASSRLGAPWQGIVKAANAEMRNGGVVYLVLRSSRYLAGQTLGKAGELRHLDQELVSAIGASPTVARLEAALPSEKRPRSEMISDTELGGADDEIRILSRTASDLRRVGQ